MADPLDRFLEAQKNTYPAALAEIRAGRKRSHWMWFIFPQLAGLGQSETSKYYAINNLDEVKAYLDHPILGSRLIAISNELLQLKGATAGQIFGSPDDLKLRSCMTLFAQVDNGPEQVFKQVIEMYFQGKPDMTTLRLLGLQ